MNRNLARAAPLGAAIAAGMVLGLVQSRLPPEAEAGAPGAESRSFRGDTVAHPSIGVPPGCIQASAFQDSSSVGFVVLCRRR